MPDAHLLDLVPDALSGLGRDWRLLLPIGVVGALSWSI
jgi:cellulose synthase/poly-beta-1,6-N-acetylglucosamine synthase-like glycosyltransferase